MSLQEMINDAKPGDTVVVPAGVYDIDAYNAPLKMRSQIAMDLSAGAIIRAIPNDAPGYQVVLVTVNDVIIKGGEIQGDRDFHLSSNILGNAGMALAIGIGARNVKIINVKCSKALADGILIRDAYGVELDHVFCDRNARQGMSCSNVDGLIIHDSQFSNSGGGTPPGAGIDLECDLPSERIMKVDIRRCTFKGNVGAGVLIATPPAQRAYIDVYGDNMFSGKPIDGTDGIVPAYAKWLGQIYGSNPNYDWRGYPRELHLSALGKPLLTS